MRRRRGLAVMLFRRNIGAMERFGDDPMGAEPFIEWKPCGSLQTGPTRNPLSNDPKKRSAGRGRPLPVNAGNGSVPIPRTAPLFQRPGL